MFHLLAFALNASTSTFAGGDMTFVTDPEFSNRNSHLLLSEKYKLLAHGLFGTLVTRGSIQCPTLNAVTLFNIWPAQTSDTIGTPPNLDMYIDYPVPLPMNEEIQINVTSTAGADSITYLAMIGPDNWKKDIPRGMPPIPMFEMRFTCSPTFAGAATTQAWAGLVNPTFEQSLRGGTYAVVGMQIQGTNLLAARIVFPQSEMINGRRMRPGVLATSKIGGTPLQTYPDGPRWLGEMGRFTTAELPYIEALGLGSASVACEGRLWLVRLSESINVNYGTNGPY